MARSARAATRAASLDRGMSQRCTQALGTGLAGSTKDFYFDVDAVDLSAVIHHKDKQRGDEGWQFSLYQPTHDHVLSVAIQSHTPVQIRLAELVP